MKPKYSVIMRWSDEDQCSIVWCPEFGTGVKSDGESHEEAARMGQEIVESMIEAAADQQRLPPQPWLFSEPESDERLGRFLFPNSPFYSEPTGRLQKAKHAHS